MMTLQQVHYFLTLCEEKNFSREAARSDVKQTSLTKTIKQLEREFGSPLFVRSRRMSRLSRLGATVKPYLAAVERAAIAAKREATVFPAVSDPRAAGQADPPAVQAKGEGHA